MTLGVSLGTYSTTVSDIPHRWHNSSHTHLKCGRLWVRALVGSNLTVNRVQTHNISDDRH